MSFVYTCRSLFLDRLLWRQSHFGTIHRSACFSAVSSQPHHGWYQSAFVLSSWWVAAEGPRWRIHGLPPEGAGVWVGWIRACSWIRRSRKYDGCFQEAHDWWSLTTTTDAYGSSSQDSCLVQAAVRSEQHGRVGPYTGNGREVREARDFLLRAGIIEWDLQGQVCAVDDPSEWPQWPLTGGSGHGWLFCGQCPREGRTWPVHPRLERGPEVQKLKRRMLMRWPLAVRWSTIDSIWALGEASKHPLHSNFRKCIQLWLHAWQAWVRRSTRDFSARGEKARSIPSGEG